MQAILEKVGKKLKKNNVSVDVVAFGDCAEGNREKLEAFVAAVNKDSNSNYVEAPMGSNLCDFLLSSPIVSQAYGGGGDAGAGAAPAAGVHSSGHRVTLIACVFPHRRVTQIIQTKAVPCARRQPVNYKA